ncbi:hypothetical protein DLJ96_11030 [Actinotalea fermentans ATCC 43279 = JCM 9966 = DSM 3133]|nr:hypothetical protein [Oerskovia turbata]RXR25720.1 hypothetical protein EQW73_09400 [Oerskovia turbata]TGJ96263.1 hypothetical protein DLJ96_11030 [Actinotalea fermentans ATCC 43279 = JCM 9966 = DSM 3133]
MSGAGRQKAIAASIFLVLSVSAGCTTQSAETPDPYAAEIEQARAVATTDLQRAVLEDGKVTDAEFSEIEQDVVRCVADRGYLLEITNGGYKLTMPDGEGFDSEADGEIGTATQDECFAERMGMVESLYHVMRQNPEREDMSTLLADCLVRGSVVDAPFSGQDYSETLADPPYDTNDPLVVACYDDPRGAHGGTT